MHAKEKYLQHFIYDSTSVRVHSTYIAEMMMIFRSGLVTYVSMSSARDYYLYVIILCINVTQNICGLDQA